MALRTLIYGAFKAMPALEELSVKEEVARQARVRSSRALAPPPVEKELKHGLALWMWKHLEQDFTRRGEPTDFGEHELYKFGKLQPMFFLALERIMRALVLKFRECKEEEESEKLRYRQDLVERVIDHPSSVGFLVPDLHREALLHIMYVNPMLLPDNTENHHSPLSGLAQIWLDGASKTLETLLKSDGGRPLAKIRSLDFYYVPYTSNRQSLARPPHRRSIPTIFESSDANKESVATLSEFGDSEPEHYGDSEELNMHLRYQKPDFREVIRSLTTLRSSSLNAKARATKSLQPDLLVMQLLVQVYADYLVHGIDQSRKMLALLKEEELVTQHVTNAALAAPSSVQ